MNSMLYNVNLLDWRQIRKQTARRRLYRGSALVSIGAVLAILMWLQPLYEQSKMLNIQIELMQQSVVSLTQTHEDVIREKAMSLRWNEDMRRIEQWRFLKQAHIALMERLSRIIPYGVYLNTVEQQRDQVVIAGVFVDADAFDELIRLLFSQALLSDIQVDGVTMMNDDVVGKTSHQFQISCRLLLRPTSESLENAS